jgi:hypothetical protein
MWCQFGSDAADEPVSGTEMTAEKPALSVHSAIAETSMP